MTTTGLCRSCFLEKRAFSALPANVDLDVCTHCRARRRGELWIDPPAGGHDLGRVAEEATLDALTVERDVRVSATSTSAVAEDDRNYLVTVHVDGEAEGISFTTDVQTRARVKNATCTRCSRVMGGYYESVVQVRAQGRDLGEDELRDIRRSASRVIERIVNEGDRNAFVLKDQVNHGGLDVYVATNNAGRQMARVVSNEFGGRVSEHPKIMGQKDGQDVWRMTFLVKLAAYRVGDVVILDNEPFLVQSIQAKHAAVRDARSNAVRSVARGDLDKAAVLAREGAQDAVVVSVAGSELQVLDPWTFKTVTVLAPDEAVQAGGSVRVMKFDGHVFVVPGTVANG